MAGDVKEYLVNYIVNSNGNAPDLFKRLAEQASAAQVSISKSVEDIQTITGQLTKAFLGTKDVWNIAPTVDNTKALKALEDLEKKVKEASARMRKDIASALNGAMPGLAKDKKTAGGTLDELQSRLDNYKKQLAVFNTQQVNVQKEFLKKGGSQAQRVKKDVEQLWGKDDINSRVLPKISKFPEAQNILKGIKAQIDTRAELSKKISELEKQLQSAPKPATTPASAARQGYAANNMVAKNDLTKKLENQIKIQERAQARYNELLAARKRAMYNYGSQNISGLYPNWQTVFGSAEETAKLPKFLQSIVAGEQNGALERSKKYVDKSNSIVSTLKKQLEDVSKIAGEKPVTIVATLNTTPAIEKANELIKTIGMRSVTIPITFGRLGEKPSPLAGEDSISKETGRLTEAGRKLTEQTNKLMEKQKSQTAKNAKVELPGIVKQMTDSVKSLNSILEKQPVNVIGKFDGGMLLGQLQEVMSSLKAYAKANPIPVLAEMSKATASAKGEKVVGQSAKGTKGAKVNPVVDSVIENSRAKIQTKAYEKPITFRSAFNGGDAAFQANMARQRIQQLVGEKPITFRSAFNGGDAAFQAQQSLVRLQKLVSEKPVNVIGKFSGVNGLNNANGSKKPEIEVMAKVVTTATQLRNQVNVLTVKIKPKEIGVGLALKKDAISQQLKTLLGKLRQSGKSKAIEIPVKIKGEKVSSKVNSIISQAKKASNVGKGISVPVKFVTKDVSSKFNALIKDLQTKANKNPIRIKAQFENGNILTQFNQSIANLQKNVERLAKMKIGGNAIGGVAERGTTTRGRTSNAAANATTAARANRDSYARSMGLMPTANERVYARQQPDRYTRMRSFLYPLTGNTSFGARTPAMVDMAKGMGTMFAVGGAMSAVGSSLSQAVEYQNTMKTAQAILQNGTTDYNKRDFDNMTKTVRNVGKDTKFTAPDVANAARFMAMAGLHTNDITKAIRPVADVALIGDTDLGATADKLTNVMTTFGLKSEQMRDIADIMTSTFTRSNTDMMMLAESAKYAGGIAHLYGSNFKDTFADTMALFGVLGNAGIQASSAGTTIRMMYQNLMQPNKKQLEALKKYNIYTRDTKGQPLQMGDILAQMSQKIPKSQMADAIGQMFRITAQPGAAALASNMDNVRQLIAANRNAPGSGISEMIAGEKQNTLSGLWAQVTSTFTEAVVQAMENRQDKWGDMLKHVRDYLSDPKTVEMISNIIDLVEMLARTMAEFAKIWVGVYHMFPNLINGWLKVQMLLTQVGYLFTPIVQITGAITMFKNALLGLGTAWGGASVAAGRATTANAAGGVVSGLSFMGGGTRNAIAATAAQKQALRKTWALKEADSKFFAEQAALQAAMTSNTEIAGFNKAQKERLAARKLQYERKANQLRNSVNTDIGYKSHNALNPTPLVTPIPGGMQGMQTKSAHQADIYMQQFAYGNNVGLRRNLANKAELRAMQIQDEINVINAKEAASAADIAARQQRINELRAQRLNLARDIRRPAQLANVDLMTRYANIAGNTALTATALRSTPGLDRALAFSGGKNAKLGWNAGFSNAIKNGRAFGSFNLAAMLTSMSTTIKSVFFSLMKGLGNAIGFLTSPVGLAVSALTLLGVGVYKLWKNAKERKEQLEKSNDNVEWINDNKKKVQDVILNGSISAGRFTPVEVGYKPAVADEEKPQYSITDNKVVASLLDKKQSGQLTGEDILNKYIGKDAMLPTKYVYQARQRAQQIVASGSTGWTTKTDAKKLKSGAEKLAVIEQWMEFAAQQDDIKQAVVDYQNAIKNGDVDKQRKILAAYKPTSGKRMWNISGDKNDVANISDPTKYYEWQLAQYQILTRIRDSYQGPMQMQQKFDDMVQSYQKALASVPQKNNKVEQEKVNDTWIPKLASTIVQAVPLTFNGTPFQLTLDKMGNVDWQALANTVNHGVPLTMQQQYDIMQNVYSAIANDPKIQAVNGLAQLLNKYLPIIANNGPQYVNLNIPILKDRLFTMPGVKDAMQNWTDYSNGYKMAKNPAGGQYILPNPKIGFNASTPTFNIGNGVHLGRKGTLPGKKKQYGLSFDDNMSNLNRMINAPLASSSNKNNAANNVISPTKKGTTTSGATGSGNKGSNQKDYASSYGRNAARPTQVNITIENLCRFDRTSISKNADDRAMVEAIENKISEAVAMLSASALNTAGQVISQGLA